MAENPSQHVENLSRRRFLKNVAKGAAVVGGLAVAAKVLPPILFPEGISPEDGDNSPSTPLPEGLSADTLTQQELEKAHIRIIPTPKVALYLRKGIFDFPLFEYARRGGLKEVVVVLVDHPSLSWNARDKLPEDIKPIYESGIVNPREKSAPEYKSKLNPQQLEQAIVSESENTTKTGTIIRLDYPYWYVNSSPVSDLLMTKGFSGEAKRLKRGARLRSNSELINKIFVFVAVGGKQEPSPDQSYLSPDQFSEIPGARGPSFYDEGTYRFIKPNTAGVILRHESSHYSSSSTKPEYYADTEMFKFITRAWEKKQKGDTSGYAFVFVTNQGLTFTKKQNGPEEPNQSV
ncbi:hypothetical protein A3B42_03295 [Candidatus Daviesbacteria bacterium RIFCSPLOWO2_01_FULL_38_10]|uniref:Twin-arginine translocation signal domain-containing protein n=1 Tax=Candidatus Daviesbacteria bacterium GW2011_GWF2_38_6 TaxID=1618432 RepID=A0A0G0KJ39_9BACT|nr:MAG: hypothetical protein US99_C0011G0007 [Candidatus Daviesbacteria bacterium GW2011_GWF2_38_6]OGE26677.1 MAG: hypothetical protein A3D02_02120 [Candidatus Daviesbacteria bacterium RIFCSPHIGHO2_02_FULL_39_41]OGE27382.1 MAG: hypothetical protein A2772_00795 [Candidatus Daviesbacteria bacterium RIFCSPHIGHO2_01_FULL_38_8b]OGE37076.1 MAG: hypothetical protein A3B42_03295 [Candidatus Daviesbacteria bacterium RIFCSPLOWO2_01_FULL_38_10]OGE45172.1 MAG: hypothetical protein A3E67_03135 [Candidatus D